MNHQEIQAVLKQITLADDWHLITVPDGDLLWLQIHFFAVDGPSRELETLQKGRKWRLSKWMTRSEIVQTALLAYLTAVEHEARETFHYQGHAVFGPHYDVDRLMALCRDEAYDVRA